ncbi:hypothetical protein BGZ59_003208 [Podila verticillata]|nr:hypothetical protein BGZ59_003208 [Podila verticillata]
MLTSLTIVYTTIFDESEDNSLHRFLCEIPTLLHLRAESVPYPIENMDLNNLLPSRTFFYTHKEKSGDRVMTTRSRILCGYLSRFCPRLEDVSIHFFQLNMALQGGFCLLIRLARLRRLHLSSVGETFSEKDVVPWICKRLSTTQKMKMMYRTSYPLDKKNVDNRSVVVQESGQEKEISIRLLGYLADVGDALTEILEMSNEELITRSDASSSSSSFWSQQRHVWPDLAEVSATYTKESFKKEKQFVSTLLKKHRPEVRFEWIWWPNQHDRKYRPYV